MINLLLLFIVSRDFTEGAGFSSVLRLARGTLTKHLKLSARHRFITQTLTWKGMYASTF